MREENEKRETIADIVKELRRQSDSESKLADSESKLATQLRKTDDDVDFASASCYAEDAKYISKIADRIEEAWKREAAIHAMTCEANERLREHLEIAIEDNKRSVGNAAAMREACEKMLSLLMLRGNGKAYFTLSWDEFNDSQKMLRDALSAPPRNCDVGTAEEQAERYDKFCDIHDCRSDCPLFKTDSYCELAWAQMPYAEEGGAK